MKEESAKSKLVFIVDDDRHVGQILAMVVQDAGLNVRLFHTPLEVVKAIREATPAPDLLITDFQMPGMNGLQVISEAKKLVPELKTLSVSGGLTNVTLREYPVRPDAMLAKPFHPKDLLLVISNLLQVTLPAWPER